MDIYFSKNIKRLRKERDLTQEGLADFLGVSFQAVSKWERGDSYPDIKMLPEIAAFFNVTIDELLGTDKIQREQKVTAYLERFNKMQPDDVSDVLYEYEKAIKEIPNESAILIKYMELLHIEKGSVPIQDYKPLSDKLINTYEKIQKYCTDDAIRIRAKRIMIQHLMWQYQCLGWFDDGKKFDEEYKKQAESIFKTLPALCDSREYLLLDMDFDRDSFDYDKWLANRRKAIEELSYLLQNVIIGYCYYNNTFTPEYKIDIIKNMNGILQMTGADNKNAIHIIYNYGHLGYLYAQIGDNENALNNLRTAAERAVAFDNLPELTRRTALFYEKEKRFRHMNMRERMFELMTKHYPLSDEFKEKAGFQEIINTIKEQPLD